MRTGRILVGCVGLCWAGEWGGRNSRVGGWCEQSGPEPVAFRELEWRQ